MDSVDGGCWTKRQLSDENDAGGDSRFVSEPVTAYMPTDRDATHYNMNHKNRGIALIFNHETFQLPKDNPPDRLGTNVDADSIAKRLLKLDFDVTVYQDLKYNDLIEIVANAAKFDHTDNDCFVMVVLSHGDAGNVLYAKDRAYKLEDLWTPFSADFCTTLAGKPKLFFIQACRGDKFMPPVILSRTETDGPSDNTNYKIPSKADFLFAYSNIPGYYSWRNTVHGSWFIEALCKELKKSALKYDILTILTFVNRRVAIDYESSCPAYPEMDHRKQISSFNSRLTRLVQFNKKNAKLDNAAVSNENFINVEELAKIGLKNLTSIKKNHKVFLDY